MIRTLTLATLTWALALTTARADRAADFARLEADYEAAVKAFFEAHQKVGETTAEKIRNFEAWPGFEYVPKFLKLSEAAPGDATAYKCCLWIVDRMSSVGNWDREMYAADERAWDMIAAHHVRTLAGADYQLTCFNAVGYVGAARERFLRAERERSDAPREERAIATLALAELLAKKVELAGLAERQKLTNEYEKYLYDRGSSDWLKDCTAADSPKFKAESIALFRELLENDADVPVTTTAPYFRNLSTVADKASKSLHALEHLSMGAEAPAIDGQDLDGKPLKLADFRGKVVVLAFWETGCGPCMAMVPQELALIEKYKGRPFAMVSVCGDPTLELGRTTAKEKGITWSCWFDGVNGPIVRDYNVLGWPTIYLLDEHGMIADKDLRGDELDAKVAELMAKKK